MNIELLRRIQAHNTEHPEQLHMGQGLFMSECETIGCIAGHACLLGGDVPQVNATTYGVAWSRVEDRAIRLLEIPIGSADRLFLRDEWPEEFRDRLIAAVGTPEYAATVNARIDHFIETGGAE